MAAVLPLHRVPGGWKSIRPDSIRQWRDAYPDKTEAWWDKHRAVDRDKSARRRAALRLATPSWVDHDALRQIYDECPDGHHVDHIDPL